MLTKADQSIEGLMADIGRKARAAEAPLALASPERKHAALSGMAQAIIRDRNFILAANGMDMEAGEIAGLTPAQLDRLKLDENRIRNMADGILAIAALKDPVGEIIAEWDRPNGLHIERVRTPLGVIGFDPDAEEEPLAALNQQALRSEAFRTIRTNLSYTDVDNPPKVVAITSSVPIEGKSTAACNLAITMAQAGLRVME